MVPMATNNHAPSWGFMRVALDLLATQALASIPLATFKRVLVRVLLFSFNYVTARGLWS